MLEIARRPIGTGYDFAHKSRSATSCMSGLINPFRPLDRVSICDQDCGAIADISDAWTGTFQILLHTTYELLFRFTANRLKKFSATRVRTLHLATPTAFLKAVHGQFESILRDFLANQRG